MLDTVRKIKHVVPACAKTWIITAWYNRRKNEPAERTDERKVGGTRKNSWRQERVAEIVNSWKSYTCFSADYLSSSSRTTWVKRHQKDKKPIWIWTKQRWWSGSGISWTICKSIAPRSRQITMPAPHHSICHRPDALPDAKPTVSKHWRQIFQDCSMN